jgi:hypothetical protein
MTHVHYENGNDVILIFFEGAGRKAERELTTGLGAQQDAVQPN